MKALLVFLMVIWVCTVPSFACVNQDSQNFPYDDLMAWLQPFAPDSFQIQMPDSLFGPIEPFPVDDSLIPPIEDMLEKIFDDSE